VIQTNDWQEVFFLFEMLSIILRYIFITVIYLFIFGIIRLIYLDIKSLDAQAKKRKNNHPYLKLINQREHLDFKVEENYTIDKNITLGRTPKNDISIIGDPYISGKHAKFMIKDGKYYLEDMDSTNGTFLNGDEVKGKAMLIKDGDKIHIGQVEFLFVDSTKRGDGSVRSY